METLASIPAAHSRSGGWEPDLPVPVTGVRLMAATMSFVAGLLTPFTVSVVGELPIGELVLMAAAAWAALCVVFNRAWPVPLMGSRQVWFLMACQVVGVMSYALSDVWRDSSGHDMARGWARMIFLGVDVLAIAFLFGCDARNFVLLLAGKLIGEALQACVFGAQFGDLWKFGVGVPVTFLVLLVSAFGGRAVAAAGAVAMGLANFVLDFRSLGGLCVLVAAGTSLHLAPRKMRAWVLPLGAIVALVGVLWTYEHTRNGSEKRGQRSDISRSSMMIAAWEAFRDSPLIGRGSWFSNSDVYDRFLVIQQDAARTAGVGGFADANSDLGEVVIHSQILVALAEGGLFGATFFFAFAAGLVGSLWYLVFVREWDWLCPVYLMTLTLAGWNLVLSPFSGAHRVGIAMAVGLILILSAERRETLHGGTA